MSHFRLHCKDIKQEDNKEKKTFLDDIVKKTKCHKNSILIHDGKEWNFCDIDTLLQEIDAKLLDVEQKDPNYYEE